MIDEKATFEKYGYYSTDLKQRSGKRVVAVCDVCSAIRYPTKDIYRDLCVSCVKIGRKLPPFTDEHRKAIGDGNRGKKYPPHTDEHCQHISAGHQGIPYEDWIGFATDNPYCNLFNEACRERIRAKYDHRCFACDKPQDENVYKSGKQIALSVHHFDMNKDQGCNGNGWKLVPLCVRCHNKVHSKMWQARIEYLLEYVWNI